MRGRGKFDAEQLILLAHTTEGFARTKRLRPAEYYLKPSSRTKPPPSAVVSMMSKMERAGLSVTVRRIPLEEQKNYGRNDSRLP